MLLVCVKLVETEIICANAISKTHCYFDIYHLRLCSVVSFDICHERSTDCCLVLDVDCLVK